MASRGGGFGRSRRQWGFGPARRDGGCGGHYDSGYGGRDVARVGWGCGSDRESRDSDRYSGVYDVVAPGSFHAKSFHDGVVRGPVKRSHSRSPHRGSSCSRSVDRFDRFPPARKRSPGRCFHKAMLGSGRSPRPLRNRRLSLRAGRGDEEEGMIPADEYGS